jgi:hypothetical protein
LGHHFAIEQQIYLDQFLKENSDKLKIVEQKLTPLRNKKVAVEK